MNDNNGLWVWGYVLKENKPDKIEFVRTRNTWCSLETAASFMGADNVVFMDSTSDRNRLNDEVFNHVAGAKQVLCGLQHHFEAETASMISRFSLTHPNVAGAMLDDFLEETGPTKHMKPEELKRVYDSLKSENPFLKLFVVRYSRQNMDEVIPFLPYLDGISFWCWVSTDHYWRYQYQQDMVDLTRKYHKEILQGLFVHDYGDTNGPQPMENLKLQLPRIGKEWRNGWLKGVVLLQNGWFDAENHREQVMYLHDYFKWFFGTKTQFSETKEE